MSEMSELNSSVEFWLVGVMISVVSLIGFIGNIICILMFKYQRLFLVSIVSLNHSNHYVCCKLALVS